MGDKLGTRRIFERKYESSFYKIDYVVSRNPKRHETLNNAVYNASCSQLIVSDKQHGIV